MQTILSFLALTLIAMLAAPALAGAAPSGTVVVAQGVDPTTLDPQNHQETPAANLATNIFDFLLERDQDLKIVPMLAESYRNVGPTVWEFKLRRGARFHNGEPVDAEAVKFTVERI
ncbi:MAG TPA: ABC transporter substrate-binding protein, partial [Methylomirabilota bacterium]|nr:ABC transporter substrate-binding protein [Methylomirabilota bacterium]